MKFKEIISKWNIQNMAMVEEIRGFKEQEYKEGFADGVEYAIQALLVELGEEFEEKEGF